MVSIAFAQSDEGAAPRQAPMIPYAELMADLPEVPLSQLSDQNISPDGRRALAINPQDWKHCETRNFVLHFIHNYVAKSVGMESEAYFRYITADLGITPTEGNSGKSHIYIFEDTQAWAVFVQAARCSRFGCERRQYHEVACTGYSSSSEPPSLPSPSSPASSPPSAILRRTSVISSTSSQTSRLT